MLSVQRKFVTFWKEKEGKNCAHSVHNDSSSMSLMSLTPHRKMIGHSQKTCVFMNKIAVKSFEKETLLFLLCGVASCCIDNLTERGIKCNFSELWLSVLVDH